MGTNVLQPSRHHLGWMMHSGVHLEYLRARTKCSHVCSSQSLAVLAVHRLALCQIPFPAICLLIFSVTPQWTPIHLSVHARPSAQNRDALMGCTVMSK